MTNTPKILTEPEKNLPLAGDADVLVAGAGPAGMSAAIAAARTGARVRLIEAHGCLGGVWTAGQLAWMFEMNQPGIPREITRRLDARGARRGNDPDRYTYDVEEMKLLLEEMCAEEGIEFQLHTRVCGVLKEGSSISHVLTESKSGRQAWGARCFADTSGDGDLAAQAGCGFDMGRPPDGECQPMTFMALITVADSRELSDLISFWDGNVDFVRHLECVDKVLAEIRRAGVDPSYARPTIFCIRDNLLALMINHEYGISAIDAADLTRATVSGRAEVNRVVKGLRSLGGPWRDMQLVATCEQIGVREGRRIHGVYTVSADDLAIGQRHEDAVCSLASPVDIHCPNPGKGKGQEDEPFGVRAYDIPLRSLISRDVPNLLMGGRCISGDFIAHASYRVTGTAASTGQAAGVAAALAAKNNCLPRGLVWKEIQEALNALFN